MGGMDNAGRRLCLSSLGGGHCGYHGGLSMFRVDLSSRPTPSNPFLLLVTQSGLGLL